MGLGCDCRDGPCRARVEWGGRPGKEGGTGTSISKVPARHTGHNSDAQAWPAAARDGRAPGLNRLSAARPRSAKKYDGEACSAWPGASPSRPGTPWPGRRRRKLRLTHGTWNGRRWRPMGAGVQRDGGEAVTCPPRCHHWPARIFILLSCPLLPRDEQWFIAFLGVVDDDDYDVVSRRGCRW